MTPAGDGQGGRLFNTDENDEPSPTGTAASRNVSSQSQKGGDSRKRRGKKAKKLDRGPIVAWIALVVSLGGLITGYVQVHGQQEQLDGQKRQLTLQQKQLDDAEGNLSIEAAYVDTYDTATKTWSTDSDHQTFEHERLMYDNFQNSEVYVVLDVFNVTHASLAIKKAGLLISGKGGIATTGVMCPSQQASGQLAPCKLPLSISAQTDTPIYLRVIDAKKQLTCNRFVDTTGLVGAVEAIDNRTWSGKTQTFDPFSPVCPVAAGPTR